MTKPESEPPTLRVHECVADFWVELAPEVRLALGSFLGALQKNPYDPDLLSKSELSNDRYACRFHEDYVIYWKLKHKATSGLVTLNSQAVARIDLLEVRIVPSHMEESFRYDIDRLSG